MDTNEMLDIKKDLEITVLIGNGFDLGLGLNTRFRDFYSSYIKNKSQDENVLSFETAWSFPEPIFEEIAKSNPDWEFEVRFADEDFGYNTGYAIYKNGKMHKGYAYKGGSVAARKNADSVWVIG
jgi:hypothetical protein